MTRAPALISLLALVLGVLPTVGAQQLEANGPGGALKFLTGINTENDPVPGTPRQLLAPRGDDVRLRVRGAGFAPFALVFGSLAGVSTPLQPANPATQWFDLDLGAPLLVVTDGFGLSGVFPYQGQLAANGTSDWTFGIGPAAGGLSFAFQAVCAHPAAFLGYDFTAAVAYDVLASSPPTSVSADDALVDFYPSQPLCFGGVTHLALEVSTNGWLRFGFGATHPDFDESVVDLVAGHVGNALVAAPAIAAFWDDLDLTGGALTVVEIMPGVVQATWSNAAFFNGGPVGTFSCTIDGSATTALLDHTGLALGAPANRGLVGAACGVAGAPGLAIDLATAGVVNVLPPAGAPRSLHQDFNVTGPVDLAGVQATIGDASCLGDLHVF